jgi:hypothetical protein
MSRSTGAKIEVTAYSKFLTSQNWSFQSPAWIRNLASNSSSGRSRASKSAGCLPKHNARSQAPPSIGSRPTAIAVSTVAPSTLHLLACAHRTQRRKCLLQDNISNVSTDQALFVFMKQQLQRNRSRIRSFLSMRTVQGMFFVKVCCDWGCRHPLLTPSSSVCAWETQWKSETIILAAHLQHRTYASASHQQQKSNHHRMLSTAALQLGHFQLGRLCYRKI